MKGAAAFLAAWLFACAAPVISASAETRVSFLDVGYGDGVLMELEGHVVLLDAGYEEYGPGVLAALKERNIAGIDTAIISHPHKNHFGGFFSVLGAVPVARIFTNAEPNPEPPFAGLMEKARSLGIPVSTLKRGDSVSGLPGGVSLRVLHPEAMRGDLNDNSLVLFLEAEGASILFTSDIGREVQAEIFRADAARIASAGVVQVPHHGDKLDAALAELFSGRLFVVSTGPNEWKLPDEEGLSSLPGRVLRTDRDGTIRLRAQGGAFVPGGLSPAGGEASSDEGIHSAPMDSPAPPQT